MHFKWYQLLVLAFSLNPVGVAYGFPTSQRGFEKRQPMSSHVSHEPSLSKAPQEVRKKQSLDIFLAGPASELKNYHAAENDIQEFRNLWKDRIEKAPNVRKSGVRSETEYMDDTLNSLRGYLADDTGLARDPQLYMDWLRREMNARLLRIRGVLKAEDPPPKESMMRDTREEDLDIHFEAEVYEIFTPPKPKDEQPAKGSKKEPAKGWKKKSARTVEHERRKSMLRNKTIQSELKAMKMQKEDLKIRMKGNTEDYYDQLLTMYETRLDTLKGERGQKRGYTGA